MKLECRDTFICYVLFFAELRVGNFRRDHAVDLLGVSWFGIVSQGDQQVKMGKASLLKFDNADIGDGFPKDALFVDFVNKILRFVAEDTVDNVGAI